MRQMAEHIPCRRYPAIARLRPHGRSFMIVVDEHEDRSVLLVDGLVVPSAEITDDVSMAMQDAWDSVRHLPDDDEIVRGSGLGYMQ